MIEDPGMGRFFWALWVDPMQSQGSYPREPGRSESEKETEVSVLRSQASVCRRLPEGRKGKEMDFPLEPLKETPLGRHLDFSPLSPILDFEPPEL